MAVYRVGITGGIGSGKSTLCGFFRLLGIPVFEADKEARLLINSSPAIRARLKLMFGDSVYRESDGLLDRQKLATLIFNDPELIRKVNFIVHPEVRSYFEQWCRQQRSPYVVAEAAILFESGFHKLIDYSILITAPTEERIKRIKKRETTTTENIQARMDNQWTDDRKAAMASFRLENNNRELVIPQLVALDKKFRTHE